MIASVKPHDVRNKIKPLLIINLFTPFKFSSAVAFNNYNGL